MKTFKSAPLLLASISLGLLAACSSVSGSKSESGKELAVSGPTIVDVKTKPGTFDLNQQLQPVSQSQVIANVKDFRNPVQDVRLRFTHIPIELPMKQVNASTWVAEIPADQLRQLAVSGHTMKYDANVVARDSQGATAVSKEPVEISVKAPDINATG